MVFVLPAPGPKPRFIDEVAQAAPGALTSIAELIQGHKQEKQKLNLATQLATQTRNPAVYDLVLQTPNEKLGPLFESLQSQKQKQEGMQAWINKRGGKKQTGGNIVGNAAPLGNANLGGKGGIQPDASIPETTGTQVAEGIERQEMTNREGLASAMERDIGAPTMTPPPMEKISGGSEPGNAQAGQSRQFPEEMDELGESDAEQAARTTGLKYSDIENMHGIDPNFAKLLQGQLEENKKETADRRKGIASSLQSANELDRTFKTMLERNKKGELGAPVRNRIADLLGMPGLLTTDAQAYNALMFDMFKDLRNTFQGQTRVKEIELLEAKLPTLLNTKEGRKSIIDARLKMNEIRRIEAQEAARIQNEFGYVDIGTLEALLQERVSEKAGNDIDGIFDRLDAIANKGKELPFPRGKGAEEKVSPTQVETRSKGNQEKNIPGMNTKPSLEELFVDFE